MALFETQLAVEAASVDEVAAVYDAVAEPKLDGVRLLARVAGGAVTYYTRAGHAHAGENFPAITAELAELPDDTWLDGELWSATGGFGAASGALHTADPDETARKAEAAGLLFYVFDLLTLKGTDARGLPLRTRREYLERLAERRGWGEGGVRLIPQHDATERVYQAYLDAGFEGAVVKDLNASYRSGKRAGWFKVKPTQSDEFVVMDYEEGKNSWAGGVGAIVIGQYEDGELVEKGTIRVKDYAMREAIDADREGFLDRVLEVRFQERTDDGRLRFPRFLRWRDDKPAREVVPQ